MSHSPRWSGSTYESSDGCDLATVVAALGPRLRRIVGHQFELSMISGVDRCLVAAPRAALERLVLEVVTAARRGQRNAGWLVLEIATSPDVPDASSATAYGVVTVSAGARWVDDVPLKERARQGQLVPSNEPVAPSAAPLMRHVQALNGHVSVELEPSGAETLSVLLPLAQDPALAFDIRSSSARRPPKAVRLWVHDGAVRVRIATLLRGAGIGVRAADSVVSAEASLAGRGTDRSLILRDAVGPWASVSLGGPSDSQRARRGGTLTVVSLSAYIQSAGAMRFVLYDDRNGLQPTVLDAVAFVSRVRHLAREAYGGSNRAYGRRS